MRPMWASLGTVKRALIFGTVAMFACAHGAGAANPTYITSGSTTFTPPADFNAGVNKIDAIGESGCSVGGTTLASGGAAGAGAFAEGVNVHVFPNSPIAVQVGAGCSSTKTQYRDAATVVADFGTSSSGTTQGLGGLAANSVGNTVFSGGNGGNGSTSRGAAGGGGAGGPQGAGRNGGGAGTAADPGAGGGSANAGTSNGGTSTTSLSGGGGNNRSSTGAGVATASDATPGGAGTAGGGGAGGFGDTGGASAGGNGSIDPVYDASHGPGSGGAGGGRSEQASGTGAAGGSGEGFGGAPGGGGRGLSVGGAAGSPSPGGIIVSWTPAPPQGLTMLGMGQ